MFNFWFVFFITTLMLALICMIFINKPLQLFFISELFWLLLITFVFINALIYDDPRFLIMGVIFFFFAAVELVLYFINYTLKAFMLKTYRHVYHIIITYVNTFRYLKCLNQ